MEPEIRTLVDISGSEVAFASESRLMLEHGRWASQVFQRYDRAAVLKIADAVAQAAHDNAEKYAKWAVEEAGFGVADHKAIKNRLTAKPLVDRYRDEDYVNLRIDPERKIVRIPRPAGVIFALSPSTNPIATINFKVILSLLTRNAIVFSPHPAVRECSVDAARSLAEAAEAAGAPEGSIQVVEKPSIPLIEAFMSSPQTNLILATGGAAMVRAAYSSSNPAIGVGPGNVPVFVDESADLAAAAGRIVESKSFDNSILCTNESVLITLDSVRERLMAELRGAGAHLCDPEETGRLRAYLFGERGFNVEAVGRGAEWIAKQCSFRARPGTKILVAPIGKIGREDPLSGEKLCPVLSAFSAATRRGAITAARAVLRYAGAGHSAAYHGSDERVALEYAQTVEAYRVVVNAPSSQGAAGFATNLPPTFTVGTGYFGRSSVGENISPHHLVHWTSIAYEKGEPFGDYSELALTHEGSLPEAPADGTEGSGREYTSPLPAIPSSRLAADQISRSELRRLIAEELRLALRKEK